MKIPPWRMLPDVSRERCVVTNLVNHGDSVILNIFALSLTLCFSARLDGLAALTATHQERNALCSVLDQGRPRLNFFALLQGDRAIIFHEYTEVRSLLRVRFYENLHPVSLARSNYFSLNR